MKSEPPAKKAVQTKHRKVGAKKAAGKVKDKQWETAKVAFLKDLKKTALPGTCAVCGDGRRIVLQVHHLNPERTIEITLCANCHDVVRRGTIDDLISAHESATSGCEQGRIKYGVPRIQN